MSCPAYNDEDRFHEVLLHTKGQGNTVNIGKMAQKIAEACGMMGKQRDLTMDGGGYQTDIDHMGLSGMSKHPCGHFSVERHTSNSVHDNDNTVDFNLQMDLMAAAGAMVAELSDVITEISTMGPDLSLSQKAEYVEAVFNTYQLQQAKDGRIELSASEIVALQNSFDAFIEPLNSRVAIVETIVADNDNAPQSPKHEKLLNLLGTVKDVALSTVAAGVIQTAAPAMATPVDASAPKAAQTSSIDAPKVAESSAPIAPVSAVDTPVSSPAPTITPEVSITPTPVETAAPPLASSAPQMSPMLSEPVQAQAVVKQVERAMDIVAQDTPSFAAAVEVSMLQQSLPPAQQVPEVAPLQQELKEFKSNVVEQLAEQTGQAPEVITEAIETIVNPEPQPQPVPEPTQPEEIKVEGPLPTHDDLPPVPKEEPRAQDPVIEPEPIKKEIPPTENIIPDTPPADLPIEITPDPIKLDTNPVEEIKPTETRTPDPVHPQEVLPAAEPVKAQPLPEAFNPPAERQPVKMPENPTFIKTGGESPPERPQWEQQTVAPIQQQAPAQQPVQTFEQQQPVFKTPERVQQQPTQIYKQPEQPVIQIVQPTSQPTTAKAGGCCANFGAACATCGMKTTAASTQTASNAGQKAAQSVKFDSFNP